jgi:hypothetical protein
MTLNDAERALAIKRSAHGAVIGSVRAPWFAFGPTSKTSEEYGGNAHEHYFSTVHRATESALRTAAFFRRWAIAGWNAGRASAGYVAFRRTGSNSQSAIMGVRGLFTAEPGLPRRFSRITTFRHRPRLALPTRGVVGVVDKPKLEEVVGALRGDGFYVFPDRLDGALVTELLALAEAVPAYASLEAGSAPVEFDPGDVVSSRYLCEQADLVDAPIVQRLFSDPSITAVADAYLQCDSLQTDVGMWQSLVFGPETRSVSSQLFHGDRDHLQFVKFFVYLTDVSSGTGPHVFVRGSHRRRPPQLRRDIRFSDEEVAVHYPAGDVVEVLGPRGTIMAVDTSGLHKGKPPETGNRWIFELEFASSLFGPGGLPMDIRAVSTQLAERLATDPRKFSRFRVVV